jgi:hypothetical protein
MARPIQNPKRKLLARTSGINLYADQAVQVQAIMESIGEKREAPVLRILLDEALAARRRKTVDHSASEQPVDLVDLAETLQTIETLLLKLIRQTDTSLCAQDISLKLIQENLAETRFGRKVLWNRLEVPSLLQTGMPPNEIYDRFAAELGEAQDSAYGLAEEISQGVNPSDENTPTEKNEELSFEESTDHLAPSLPDDMHID